MIIFAIWGVAVACAVTMNVASPQLRPPLELALAFVLTVLVPLSAFAGQWAGCGLAVFAAAVAWLHWWFGADQDR